MRNSDGVLCLAEAIKDNAGAPKGRALLAQIADGWGFAALTFLRCCTYYLLLILFSPLTFGVCVLISFCCMSARKIEAGGSLQQVTVEARQTRLSLSPDSVIISKHGIEFRSATAFSPWTEMTMTLQSSRGGEGKVNCNGVV